MVKMTFTLDDQTVAKLRRTAERHNKPQSWVVREAVADYAAKSDMLTPEEKARMLEALERFKRTPCSAPKKPLSPRTSTSRYVVPAAATSTWPSPRAPLRTTPCCGPSTASISTTFRASS